MSDLERALGALAERAGGVRAALVVETSGIEVACWGRADFEAAAAEWAELWRQVRAGETLGGADGVASVTILGARGGWVALPVGGDYLLLLAFDASVPPGRARFYAAQWARERGEEFA
ncbi:MAG: hypothetical protein Kow0092_20470 [Deferrisomatales bacterium]